MDETAVVKYITDTFADVQTTNAYGYTFFFYGEERMLPFATLAASDSEYDSVSNLSRPGVFRLNIGVGTDTYRSLFGPKPAKPGPSGVVDTGHDFTALDELLPHPSYAPQAWICVLSPSDATFEKVRVLLAEAYEIAARRAKNRSGSASE